MSRRIVEDVLGRDMTRELWTGNYNPVIPLSIQDFDLAGVLPAVFYMFRWGYRRGQGNFLKVFGAEQGTAQQRRRSATIDRVAEHISKASTLQGFQGDVEQAILGDLLLCYCLENKNHEMGRDQQIQRVAPAHYMASWIDLPDNVVNLRFVPEMLIALLANQDSTDYINQTTDRTLFAVGKDFRDNALLRAFHKGIEIKGIPSDRKSDYFVEDCPVGIDQLVMIRLAQQLHESPDKLRGREKSDISNQRPIAEKASRYFSEDIRRFIRAYAQLIPRQSLVPMLESSMAIGLTTILTSVVEILMEWSQTGEIRKKCDQKPSAIFTDCSNGVDSKLRALAEQSMDDFMRKMERLPVILMALRILDYCARHDPTIRKLNIKTIPYATEWINLLGEVMHKRRQESEPIFYNLEQKANALAERLHEENLEVSVILENSRGYPNPVWRLAEALSMLMGRRNLWSNYLFCFESLLHINRSNGLASKRRTKQTDPVTGAKSRDVRSLVFTDTVLDYLVHLHLLRSSNHGGTRALSFKDFLHILQERYGFYVDVAPPGMQTSNDMLQRNRAVLERRLRDLGLLAGVNDAEAMKRLVPRYRLEEDIDHDDQ
ncbi:MAG TPA: hypothetical protein PKV38_14555 [bacterium]|nr:hypothetical protein [bacterium]